MSLLRATTLLVLALGSTLSAGCAWGGEAAFTPVAGSNGPYCQTYRAWKVYELDRGEAFDQPGKAALRTWWNAYVIVEETMLRDAPSQIREAVAVKVGHIRTTLTPLLERYDFDLQRVRLEGTADEQAALFGLPPARLDEAQMAQYAYEDETCGMAPTPPAARLVFAAASSSKGFCSALGALDGEFEKIASSKFDPGVLRTLVTSNRFAELLDELNAKAPAEIADEVEADTAWFRGRWSDVVAEYGYDLRRVWVDATPEDLAVFNRTHPDVLEHTSRITAYEEQICGA